MRVMRKVINYLLYRLLLIFILLASMAIFLFTTTPGLYLSLKTANLFLPGTLTFTKPHGRLVDQFTLGQLLYTDQQHTITIVDLTIHWSLHNVIHQHEIVFKQVQAQKVIITTNARSAMSTPKPFLKLPFPLIIQQAHIKALQVGAVDLQKLHCSARLTNEVWQINHLQAQQQRQRLQYRGTFIPHLPYTLDAALHFSSLPHNPTAINGDVTVQGDWRLYHWQGQFTRPAKLTVQGQLKNGDEVNTLLAWQQLHWPLSQNHHLSSDKGQIKIAGTLTHLTVTSEAHVQAPLPLQFAFNAKRTAQQWSAQGFASMPQGKLRFTSTYDLAQKTLQGMVHPDIPGLVTALTLKGQLQDNHTGNLSITMAQGHYQKPDLQPLLFAGGQLQLMLDKQQLHAQGRFTLDKNKNAALNLTLPQPRLSQFINQQQPLRGQLVVKVNSLDFLKELNPAINAAAGQLQMRLNAQGTLYKPVLQGEINLRNGSLSLPAGIDLHPIEVKLTSKNQQWTTKGRIVSRNNALTLSGNGEFSPTIKGIIHLDGQDFPLLQTEEYQINISPKLVFDFSPSALALRGELIIPKASLKPRVFTSSVNVSDDVVYSGDQPNNPNPLHLTTQVHLAMGKDVAIAIKGLKGFLDGAIDLHQRPDEPLRATGELSIREGKYNAYGQDLTITQGQLLFSGGAVENPGIKLRAIRQFNNANNAFAGSNRLFDFNAANVQTLDYGGQTTVGVQMSGRLSNPKLQLFSVPANLSQADILSMLILGKPASQANQSGGQLLLTAISSMNLNEGSNGLQLLEQLKKKLGGVDMNVENNTQYNQKTNQTTEGTSFVVGKALSHRLYLSYNLGSTQSGGNLLTLRYLLNKFFSVQVSASPVASGVDLLYTH